MPTIEVRVRRVSFLSSKSFNEVIERLTAAIGHPDISVFHRAMLDAASIAELEEVVRRAVGSSELMEYASYVSFSDPDGNVWLLHEIRERLPGRVARPSLNRQATGILQEALKSAAAALGGNGQESQGPHVDWPSQYADHMVRTLSASGYHLTGPSAS